jgi:hypothetical protein
MASISDIEYQFKHEEINYPDAIRALIEDCGLSPREAFALVGQWNEDIMGDGE